jgi:hypothetical protein
MSDETTTDTNKITIDISEYNRLKASDMRVSALETDLGKEREKIGTLSADYDALKKTKKVDGPSKEDLEKEIRSAVQAQIDELSSKTTNYEARIKKMLVTDKVLNALGDKVIPDAKRYLIHDIERDCELEGDLDNPRIIFKDERGNKMYSAKKADEDMDVQEYVEKLQSRAPSFFKSSTRGAEGDNGNKTTSANKSSFLTKEDVDTMSREDLHKIAKENPERLRGLI